MPLSPEEPQIHESVPGRAVASPRPVPGPRPARPGRPGPHRAQATRTPHSEAKSAAPAGPQLQLIPSTAQGAVDAADEAVDLLLDSGRPPGEVLVLTTGDPHPWAAHELSFGEEPYWAQQSAADDVFYATAGAERLTARPVVVVAVDGGDDTVVAAALAGAMRLAGALLVLCGDPARINTLAGAGV
ncbi:hypothetical protein SRB5_55240 [Streptomyces sp. RB5]|uniref:Uncharacterized protein n=1 Tax=Streptomyces smaragdinus TaxID=2585196 RepID=A0A7K0CPE3_9ACTN|nr:hypothetical protein [Streptomyces smaragdinus]MQY15345.1 hypothetical protein [Streptomyces smaragdinus]